MKIKNLSLILLKGLNKEENKMYKLKWNGEIIEEDITTLEEANTLKTEYQMAFNGPVKVLRQ